jgi:hypothetical protein
MTQVSPVACRREILETYTVLIGISKSKSTLEDRHSEDTIKMVIRIRWMHSTGQREGPMAGSCKGGNESFNSHRRFKILWPAGLLSASWALNYRVFLFILDL